MSSAALFPETSLHVRAQDPDTLSKGAKRPCASWHPRCSAAAKLGSRAVRQGAVGFAPFLLS